MAPTVMQKGYKKPVTGQNVSDHRFVRCASAAFQSAGLCAGEEVRLVLRSCQAVRAPDSFIGEPDYMTRLP